MKEVSREQAINTLLHKNNDGKLLLRIDEKKRTEIVGGICQLLIGNNLSLAQAEMLLDLAKGCLYRMHL